MEYGAQDFGQSGYYYYVTATAATLVLLLQYIMDSTTMAGRINLKNLAAESRLRCGVYPGHSLDQSLKVCQELRVATLIHLGFGSFLVKYNQASPV